MVFSTKNREPFLTVALRPRVFEYLSGSLKAIECPSIAVGGLADHVHLLFGLARTLPISKVAEEVKKESSKWAKGVVSPQFSWQNGYGAFSVSPSNGPQVQAYIAKQEEHHHTRTFQDEFRALLRRNGVDWDERYVWE
jgi:REP element-mobilizing transposase RayT